MPGVEAARAGEAGRGFAANAADHLTGQVGMFRLAQVGAPDRVRRAA